MKNRDSKNFIHVAGGPLPSIGLIISSRVSDIDFSKKEAVATYFKLSKLDHYRVFPALLIPVSGILLAGALFC